MLFVFVLLLLFLLSHLYKNSKSTKNKILEPGAVSLYPPAPTLRSQKVQCYKCQKYD